DLRLQVTVFQSTVTDLITSRNLDPAEVPAGFAGGSMNINANKLRSRGIEADVLYSLDRNWKLDAAYTHVNAVITESELDPSSVGRQLGGVPKNAASVGIGYRQSLGWSGGVRARYTGEFTTLFKRRFLGGVTVFDANASYAFSKTFSFFGLVQNL